MTINKTTETQHIDPKTYLALANFVSKDKTRFYLHGITGHRSVSTVEGEQSVAIVTGYQSRAKAVEGSWIVVAERDDDLNIIDIKAALAGRDVKPDTFYVLKDGEFVEAGE